MTQQRQNKPRRSASPTRRPLALVLALVLAVLAPTLAGLPGMSTQALAADGSASSVPVYRLYNPYEPLRLYTTSKSEYDSLVKIGWNGEGVGWQSPQSGTAVWRLYNRYNGEHLYTTSKSEYDSLVKIGWNGENIAFYSADSQDGLPVRRFYNPYITGTGSTHHYTTDESEAKTMVSAGWRAEGVAFYGVGATRDVSVKVSVIGPSEQGFYVPWTGSTDGTTVKATSSETALDATEETGLTSNGSTFTYSYTTYDASGTSHKQTMNVGKNGSSQWKLYSRTSSNATYKLASSTDKLTDGEELLWYYDDGTPLTGTATLRITGPDASGTNHDYLATTSAAVSWPQRGWDFVSSVSNAHGAKISATDSQYGKYITGITDPSTGKVTSNTSGSNNTYRYWSLTVDGQYSNYGISNIYVRPGDSIELSYV